MAKKKIEIKMQSYGIYTQWDRGSKALPKIKKHTLQVPAIIDIEFGYILKITGAKGKLIEFEMEHPPFTDNDGNIRPTFIGEHYINGNDWQFFLGDTIWAPIEDKAGIWTLVTYLDGKEIVRKSFEVYLPGENDLSF